jgi:hypothetical protein
MSRKTYGHVCCECGARLDPHERCDCEQERAEQLRRNRQRRQRKALADNEAAVQQSWEEWLYD